MITLVLWIVLQQSAVDLVKQIQETAAKLMALVEPAPPIVRVSCDTIQAAVDGEDWTGRQLLLPAGAQCGGLTLKGAGGVITTDGVSLADGARMTPATGTTFASFSAAAGRSAIFCGPDAHGWTLRAIAVKGTGASTNATIDGLCPDLLVNQVVVLGDPLTGAKVGITLNSRNQTVTNSWIADIKREGQDAQAIVGTQGECSPCVIRNNYLEASGENILFGGDDPREANLVPANITIEGNTLSKPLAWRTDKGPAGKVWQVKNLLELKNAAGVSVKGNVLENVWAASQGGYAVMVTPRNQGGGCPWCVVRDVTFDGNTIRNVAGGFNLLGIDNINQSQRTTNIRVLNTTVTEFDGTGNGYVFLVNGINGLEIRNFNLTGTNVRTVLAFDPKLTDGLIVDGFDSPEGKYGVFASTGNGILALEKWAPGYQWSNVTLRRGASWAGGSAKYPAGTTIVK